MNIIIMEHQLHFFTNAFLHRGSIYYTGYDNGERVKRKVRYEPYLFFSSKSNKAGWKTLDGKPVDKKTFDNIPEANKFVREHKDISNFSFYGNTNYLYTWINDTFLGQMQYDSSLINVIFLDIEVASDEGFPNYRNAIFPITAITISKHGKKITFGCKEYKPKSADVAYFHCKNEKDMLQKFITVWNNPQYNPDVLTGWNVEGFDIPYLYNRITNLFSEDYANKLSPWGFVEKKEVQYKFGDRTEIVYDLKGISTLDYLALYRKFSFKNQESYSLNFICSAEIDEKKTDYSEHDSLLELYKNDYEKFIDYNIRDVELVEKLDDKLKILEQVFAIAYDAKVLYADTLTTLRMWDTLIHNYLLEQYIVVPPVKKIPFAEIIGGYVKEPQIGMHKWVVSFDLTSLYPHLIMQYNIGPDTFVKKVPANCMPGYNVENVISWILKNELDSVNKYFDRYDEDVAVTANLCCYRKDKQSFLGALMEKVYQDRFKYKKLMIEAQREYEKTKDPELKKKIAQYDYMQMAKKIQLNSGYGALANPYFRFYDPDNAEAVTATGQLAIRWVADRVNKYMNKLLTTEGKDYIIASDTDSIYLSFNEIVEDRWKGCSTDQIINNIDAACKNSIVPYIDKCYVALAKYTNAYKNCMVMKRESIAEKAIWTAKKRHILNVWDSEGVKYDKPKLKIHGIESVRSSTPSSCRENIKKVLNIIMNEDQASLIKFVEDFREEFKKLPVDEIAFPRSISGIKKYKDTSSLYKKACPIQVKGALIYNHLLSENKLDKKFPMVYDGDKIKFVYLKMPNPVHEYVISFTSIIPEQFGLKKYLDYNTQFEKGFLDPVRTITDAIGWKLEHVTSLEDFL